jgi:hypothetical protein
MPDTVFTLILIMQGPGEVKHLLSLLRPKTSRLIILEDLIKQIA